LKREREKRTKEERGGSQENFIIKNVETLEQREKLKRDRISLQSRETKERIAKTQ